MADYRAMNRNSKFVDVRKKLAATFSTPAPKFTPAGRPGVVTTPNPVAGAGTNFLDQMAKRYTVNTVKGIKDVVEGTISNNAQGLQNNSLYDPNSLLGRALGAAGPMGTVMNYAAGNALNNNAFSDAIAPADFAGSGSLVKLGASGVLKAAKFAKNPATRGGIISGAKAVGPSLGKGLSSGGFGELFSGVSEAAGAGARRAVRKTSAVERNVEEALTNPEGGKVVGLSKLASNLVALGFPLDPAAVRQLDPESLRVLGATKNLALTGPYSIRAKLEPTTKELEKRVSGLLGGTKQRLSRTETPELFDPKTNLDDLLQNTEEITGAAEKLLEGLHVPVDESLSAVDAIAGKPTHLIDDWQKFRGDNPNVPFSLIRQAPNARGYFAMGPAGEHPFSVGAAERVGNTTGWNNVPDLNSLMFWLHSLPNIRKGGQNPVSFVPEFRKMFPGIADRVMPKGGYVDKSYDKAIKDMRKLQPDFLDNLKIMNLDQMIKDMGKFG